MAMSDCNACWDTPCTCGEELKHRPTPWLENQLLIVQRELESRKQAQLNSVGGVRLNVAHFNQPSPNTGYTYLVTPKLLEELAKIKDKEFPIEYGVPILRDRDLARQEARARHHDPERLCGTLSKVELDPTTFILQGDFVPSGPFAEVVAKLLNPPEVRFSIRSRGNIAHHHKTRTIDELIGFDINTLPSFAELTAKEPKK